MIDWNDGENNLVFHLRGRKHEVVHEGQQESGGMIPWIFHPCSKYLQCIVIWIVKGVLIKDMIPQTLKTTHDNFAPRYYNS